MVRPWNEPRMVMILYRPTGSLCILASLMAASIASAPLLQKKHLPPPKECSAIFCASWPWGSV